MGYSEKELKLGRHHKNLTLKNIIEDISAAINWVQEKYPKKKISIIGFCFGGHAAVIASSLKGIDSTFRVFMGCLLNLEYQEGNTNFAPI